MSLEKKTLNQEITNELYKYVNPVISQPLVVIRKSPEPLYLYGLGLTGGGGTIIISKKPTKNQQQNKFEKNLIFLK